MCHCPLLLPPLLPHPSVSHPFCCLCSWSFLPYNLVLFFPGAFLKKFRSQSDRDRWLQHPAAGGPDGVREPPVLDWQAAADDRTHRQDDEGGTHQDSGSHRLPERHPRRPWAGHEGVQWVTWKTFTANTSLLSLINKEKLMDSITSAAK